MLFRSDLQRPQALDPRQIIRQHIGRGLGPEAEDADQHRRDRDIHLPQHWQVDQRVLDARGFEEVAVGDAVLAGGEAAALVTIEACVRLVPGVLGQAESLSEESFEDGLLEHPQYTRPRAFEGLDIPEVLLGGNHAEVRKWRQAKREETTRERRPDLWAQRPANQQAKGD